MAEQRGDEADAERRLIESQLEGRWELEETPPGWVVDAARSDGLAAGREGDGASAIYDGTDYEYKVVPAARGGSFHVFLRPHDEHVRAPYSAECPHCEHRIAKGEDESVLYCDDCGWSPGDFVNGDVGVCPHCEQHISRDEDETFLQCPDCGWTIGLPVLRHLLWRR
jgi:predicted RNA-binding Zn-ribbon protein involved in translation (DUF1610 family)